MLRPHSFRAFGDPNGTEEGAALVLYDNSGFFVGRGLNLAVIASFHLSFWRFSPLRRPLLRPSF